jgi:hypothetical protein
MLAATLFRFSSFDGVWVVLLCLAGAAIGTYLFFNGFRMLRYKRLILNTPLSRIHSASIGLVEVTGTPIGPKTLAAPVTGTACYFYRVKAWQWQESGKDHEWKQVLDESLYLPFFLEDSTGRMLIDPQGADMDVHRSFSDEIGASFFRSRDLLPENIRDFLVKRGLVPYEKIKIEERVIQPGFPLFVFGTLGDNPAPASWEPRPYFAGRGASSFDLKFSGGPGLGITWQSAKTGSQSRLALIPDRVAENLRRSGVNIPASMVAPSAVTATALVDTPPADPGAPSFDLHPSAAISRGERGEPFTISWHSQKEVVQALAWKSTLYIWGGPVLAIASLYFLLFYWDLISL